VLVEALGDEHMYALDARRVLAETRAHQGRFREAERFFDQVIEAQGRVLGKTHSELMKTFYSRALLSAAREERQEALSFLRRAVEGGWAQRRIYTEPALASLRGDAAFTEIVATVRDKVGELAATQGTEPGDSP
jgi:tetratricopeptide (TPR) repeat protein